MTRKQLREHLDGSTLRFHNTDGVYWVAVHSTSGGALVAEAGRFDGDVPETIHTAKERGYMGQGYRYLFTNRRYRNRFFYGH